MSYSQTEEIQYCTRCGSANKKSAAACQECGKKIVTRHRPFWYFVKKHTKSGVPNCAKTIVRNKSSERTHEGNGLIHGKNVLDFPTVLMLKFVQNH
jgi:predicted RNA-binding Zn-ribbon protein involved in translation (DUF1610 family)